MPVNSASWAAYCVVKAAGMCWTRMTAAGNSRVKPGARRITVAGPPVEAARTTTGKRWSRPELGAGRLAGAGAFGADHADFRGHADFSDKFVFDAVHVQINAARRLGDKLDGAEFESAQGAGGALARFRTDDNDGTRIGGHDLRGGLQAVHVRHVDVHGDDIGFKRFRQRDRFAAVLGVADDLELFVGVENGFQHLAHEGGIVHDEDAVLFAGASCHKYLCDRHDWTRRLRSHELFHRRDELIFLHRLGEEGRGAFLDGAVAVLRACARGDDHHRDTARGWTLAQLSHQLVTRHARHFQVRDDEMAAVLGDEFGGFEAVGGQLDAIAILFEHASHELADGDGVVGDDDNAFVLDAIDSFGRYGTLGDGGGARREDARGGGAGLNGAALGRLVGDHAVEVDEQNQAAIGSDGGAGEEFDAAEILAEVLDHDFVFPQHFLDDEADLPIAGIGDNHAEVAVDGLERRKAEVGVETDDLGDDVADLGEELAADVLNFVGADTANFFHHGERESKAGAAAADKERGRNDERERNLEGKAGALAAGALDIDFAVERGEIGANNVEADAAAGEFGFDGRGREARMEKHFAKVTLGEAAGGLGRNESALDGALLHAFVVDAAAIIFDFDVDVIAAMVGAQEDSASFGFSGGETVGRRLDPVGDGVANQVNQGIGNLL